MSQPAGQRRTWHTNGRGTEQLTHTFALIALPAAAFAAGSTSSGKPGRSLSRSRGCRTARTRCPAI